MEQNERAAPGAASGVTRTQNVLYVLPHDWAAIGQVMAPIVQRVDQATSELQALIVTSDAESAASAAATAAKLTEGRNVSIVAATSARRAARLIRAATPQIVAGPPETLAELVRATAIKLTSVRTVCLAWADELSAEALAALETIMGDVPKDAPRTIVASEATPAVDQLIERYARRARRIVANEASETQPIDVQFTTVSPRSRSATIVRILDAVDPRTAVVFARENADEVQSLLSTLGYRGPDASVTVALAAPPDTDLVILYDLPASRAELREAVGASKRAIALIQPRQLTSLRALAAGGAVRPISFSDAAARHQDRQARLRDELREALTKGLFGRELIALEPLLDDFDAIEIAAAAVQLLESERANGVTPQAQPATSPPASAPPRDRDRERDSGPMTRLFVNVGARDSARPADFVGTFVNEAGVQSGQVGRVDIRDSHTIVEVAANAADTVIERITGTAIRGRRAIVRKDEERPRRSASDGPRDRGDRGSRGDRGDRGDRGGARGERPRGRSDRPRERSDRGERSSRPRDFGDRPRDRDARPPRDRGAASFRRPRRGDGE